MNQARVAVLLVIAACVAAIVAGASAVPGGAQTNATATMSQPLTEWLATAADGATFETIVTFDSREAMSRLDSLGVGATELQELPTAFATLSATQIRQVASWPETRSLWHDQQNSPILDESVPLVGADRVRAGTGLRSAYTGAGVNVAVIDTGVDGLHPDVPAGAKVEQYALAGSPFEREPMTFTPLATGDTYGHGTHVSSTIAGLGAASGGRYIGVAPGRRSRASRRTSAPFSSTATSSRASTGSCRIRRRASASPATRGAAATGTTTTRTTRSTSRSRSSTTRASRSCLRPVTPAARTR
jgi:serine protease AprX